jgi:hypothetical protein
MSTMVITPSQALSYHADLVAQLKTPNPQLVSYLLYYMQDCVRGVGGIRYARGLFYPAISDNEPRIERAHADATSRMIGHELSDATTYQVTTEMCDAMQGVYANTEAPDALDKAELPEANGWAWFDKSWPLRDLHGDVYQLRAVSWLFFSARPDQADPVFGGQSSWPCARITLWVHLNDDPPERVTPQQRLVGQLQIIHTAVIPFGIPFPAPEDASDQMRAAESFLGIIHLLWMFLGMEITATTRPRIQNHYRKHALRSLKHGEVHVVMLRRVRYHTDPSGFHRKIDWQARWVVQGHWRHLSNPMAEAGAHVHRAIAMTLPNGDQMCAVCAGDLTWIRPYIKGPDGLSLKVSRTLHKLAR